MSKSESVQKDEQLARKPNVDVPYHCHIPAVCRLQSTCRIPHSSTARAGEGGHTIPILKTETLRLREFKRLVQDHPKLVSTNGRAAHSRVLSPASPAAAGELSLKQQ